MKFKQVPAEQLFKQAAEDGEWKVTMANLLKRTLGPDAAKSMMQWNDDMRSASGL